MRAILWVAIGVAAYVSFLIGGCSAEITDKPVSDDITHYRVCDDKGVCCYRLGGSNSVSCVATKVIIIVSPGVINDESDTRGKSRPQIERGARLLGQSIFVGHME